MGGGGCGWGGVVWGGWGGVGEVVGWRVRGDGKVDGKVDGRWGSLGGKREGHDELIAYELLPGR